MKTGSRDEMRMLADLHSGREALQDMAASLKVLVERSEPRTAVEARLEAAIRTLFRGGVTPEVLSLAIQELGRTRDTGKGLSVAQLRAARELAQYLAALELDRLP